MKRFISFFAALLVASAIGFSLARYTSAPPSAAPSSQEVRQQPDDKPRNALTMTDAAIKAAGVLSETAQKGGLDAEVIAQATVTAAPGGEAVIAARAGGTVVRLNKRLGDVVSAGEVLAIIESREAAQIAAERSTAKAKATLAERNLAREKLLYEEKVSARVDLEQAEAEAAQTHAEEKRAEAAAMAANLAPDGRNALLISPIGGRITSQTVSLGTFLQPETPAFRVVDPKRIQIEVAVGAGDAARLAAGDHAIVERPDGTVASAIIRTLTPSLDSETRAATAVLELASATALPPGQAVRVRLLPADGTKLQAVVVPEEAIQSVEGNFCVFVRTPDGFRIRPVTVGRRSAGRAEIVAGLAAGDEIATKGMFLLKAELGKSAGEDE